MNNYFTDSNKLIESIIENMIGYYYFSKTSKPYLIDVFEISVKCSDPIFDEVEIYTIKINNKIFFIYKYLKSDGKGDNIIDHYDYAEFQKYLESLE